MRSAINVPRVPWRGVAAFVLDNVIPLLGFTALVIGAFHLPGVWGAVGGYVLAGISLLKIHDMIQGEELAALKARAKSEAIERAQERQRAELEARRLRVAA
jgi:hypothetical protein